MLSPSPGPSSAAATILAPSRLEREVRRLERQHEADVFQSWDPDERFWLARTNYEKAAETKNAAEGYAARRAAEHELADFFENTLYRLYPHRRTRRRAESGALQDGRAEYLAIAEKLRNCRLNGTFGVKPCGSLVVAWEEKCGLVRLCPDESRTEGQRLRSSYEPSLLRLVREGASLYRAVFTLKNYPPGRLLEGKRYIFKRFRDRILRAKVKGKPAFPVVGALAVQEDPLSAHGDWNIHLNVILVCSSYLDFGALRAAWAANVEIARVPPNYSDSHMARLWNEVIKYAVRTVPEKSTTKAGAGSTAAPAFTDWPPALADEWWQAGKGFRRSRNYGQLKAEEAWIGAARKELNMSGVTWLGRLSWDGKGYRRSLTVPIGSFDSIRADNSTFESSPRGWQSATGPPDGQGSRH
jgi:hypothetical protein